ncbi:prolyl oligopeptidase family serine peptidase [Chloroflexi bacterium TSY]|nr:prolyl oligopeptidase family serine peptidase [Chloroflexi bacterium TSY]
MPGQGTIAPNGEYIIDSYSTISEPPVTVVRDKTGKKLYTLVEADVSALYATGWRPPDPFVVKAADGVTDIYGFFYKPTNFDSTLKYPVIEKVYAGPQAPWTSHNFMGSFVTLPHLGGYDLSAMAELGFITINIEGRGAPRRGLAFRHAFSRDEDVLGSIDHRVAIEQLADQYNYIDASRVGVTGESFGGYFSARAMLLQPGFYDVAVSKVGPHDYRSVGEEANIRYFGRPAEPGATDDFFETISNLRLADRLEGDLLLVYGTIDENVRLNQGMLLIDALIKAGKDFDILIVPGGAHMLDSADDYVRWRTMTCFMEHLGDPVRQ